MEGTHRMCDLSLERHFAAYLLLSFQATLVLTQGDIWSSASYGFLNYATEVQIESHCSGPQKISATVGG